MTAKQKVDALILAGNTATGESRTDLTAVVQDLVDGYGTSNPIELSLRDTSSTYRGIYISNGNGFVGTNSKNYVWGTLYKSDKSNFVFNPALANNNCRVVFKIKIPPTFYSNKWPIAWITTSASVRGVGTECFVAINGDSTHGIIVPKTRDANSLDMSPNFPCLADTWYYVCIYQTLSSTIFSLYSEEGELLNCIPYVSSGFASCSYAMTIGGYNGTADDWSGSIDITESFFEIDGVCVWGKTNNKTNSLGVFDFTNPASFTKVDWIETTGTQLLDTGIYVQPTIKFDMDINVFLDIVDSSGCAFFMSNWDTSVPAGAVWSFRRDTPGKYWTQTLGNAEQLDKILYGNEEMHSAHIESGSQTFDGVQYGTRTITSSYSNKTIKIGGGDFRWGSGNHFSHTQIGEIAIALGTTPTRDLIPVYHNATGVRGAFDAVNNRFHKNVGTGTFGIPSDTSGEINLAEYLASLN